MVKGLLRPAGALKVQLHLEASIVQMKTTMSGSASPIASDPPLKLRAQPDLRISASFSRRIASARAVPSRRLGTPDAAAAIRVDQSWRPG